MTNMETNTKNNTSTNTGKSHLSYHKTRNRNASSFVKSCSESFRTSSEERRTATMQTVSLLTRTGNQTKSESKTNNTRNKAKHSKDENLQQIKTFREDLLAFSSKKLCIFSSCRPGDRLIQFYPG